MSGTGSLLSVIVAALAVLGAGGSAFAFLADRGNKDRLAGLRTDISDRDVRIHFLESENDRISKQNADQATHILALEAKQASLDAFLNGVAGPQKVLTEMVAAHHKEMTGEVAFVKLQLADLLRISGDRRTTPDEVTP